MKRRFLRLGAVASCSIIIACLVNPSIAGSAYDVLLAEASTVSAFLTDVSLTNASLADASMVSVSLTDSSIISASPASSSLMSASSASSSLLSISPAQTPAGNLSMKPCDKSADFYARLRSYYRADKKHSGVSCSNDDGACLNRCPELGDNDCRVLASLRSSHEFLLSKKIREGYTPDPRDSLFKPRSEFYRLVPCMQAQGYLNLYASTGEKIFLDEACSRLDFIASHLGDALSNTCYDGQMGWAFLDAYKMTCNEQYLEIGLQIARQCTTYESKVLNWGVFAAINLLRAYEITGTESFLNEASGIVDRTIEFQNSDGSFPHQATAGERNLPYTSWLAQELVSYDRLDPAGLAGAIDKLGYFLSEQVASDGRPVYFSDSLVVVSIPDPTCVKCASKPGKECPDYCATLCEDYPELLPCHCITDPYKECPRIDSLMNLTYYDEENAGYDVRGWTSELPSTAFVLDGTGRLEGKWKMLDFLFSLQNADGSFPDKWGFIPRPTDDMWEFASDAHSVIRTSCVFFYLSGIMRLPESFSNRSLVAAATADDVAWAGDAEIGDRIGDVASSAGADVGEAGREAGPGEISSSAAAETDAEIAAVDSLITGHTDGLDAIVRILPNPCFGTAMISFEGSESLCTITVLDVSGRVVRELAEEVVGPGKVFWNGLDDTGNEISPGVYFVNVTSGARTTSTKVVVLRELS